jgi:hypothetical protein
MGSTTTTLKGKRKTRWNPAKALVIESLADLYCATPKELTRFIKGHEPSLIEVRGTRAILQRIMDYDAHRQFLTQKEFFHNSSTSLFGLSEYGAKYAREILGCKNARPFEVRDTEHEFLITLFHIRLQEFCRAQGFTLVWEQNAINHKHLINPDAIARITTPKGTFTFCIEPERQSFTENHLKKGMKYHSVFGKPECKELFGAEKVRIIFIVLSERKRTFILQEFAKEYPYRMFWFTTVDSFMNDIGADIFKTPKDWEKVAYSFLSIQ